MEITVDGVLNAGDALRRLASRQTARAPEHAGELGLLAVLAEQINQEAAP